MVAAGLSIFLDAVDARTPLDRIDKTLLDTMIAVSTIASARDSTTYASPTFKLESSWRGLKLLVDRTDWRNVRLERSASKAGSIHLRTRPSWCSRTSTSASIAAPTRPAGRVPYSAMISGFEFENTRDVALERVSKVAASAHCPFIGAVGREFFGKPVRWRKIPDLKNT
jgi:type VI secretion system protein ImpC